MLNSGTLEPSKGPYRNPAFLVKKKKPGEYRLISSVPKQNSETFKDTRLPPIKAKADIEIQPFGERRNLENIGLILSFAKQNSGAIRDFGRPPTLEASNEQFAGVGRSSLPALISTDDNPDHDHDNEAGYLNY